jgi:hypothetical protein
MADRTATFEAGVNGASVTTAGGEASATAWSAVADATNVTYNNAIVAHGSLAAKLDHTSAINRYMSWTGVSSTDHYGRFYLYVSAYPGSNVYIYELDLTGAPQCLIRLTTTGKLQWVDLTGTGAITTASVNLAGWSRIEYHIVHSATVGSQELKLFNDPDSVTETETISNSSRNNGASVNQFYFGMINAAASGWVQYLDDIVDNATSYPGPAVVPAGATFMPPPRLGRVRGG